MKSSVQIRTLCKINLRLALKRPEHYIELIILLVKVIESHIFWKVMKGNIDIFESCSIRQYFLFP